VALLKHHRDKTAEERSEDCGTCPEAAKRPDQKHEDAAGVSRLEIRPPTPARTATPPERTRRGYECRQR